MKAIINFLSLILVVGLSACSTTQQADDARRSGFLGDYSKFKTGSGDQALLVYKNPSAPWGKYSSVLIDPVLVYMSKGADLRDDSREERKILANYFTSALQEELKKHFTLTRKPGPNVLRVRVALTDGDQSEVLLDTISTVMPIGLAVSSLKRVTFGSDTGVGFAQAEAEVQDSQRGVRLAAAVDKRYGTKAVRGKLDSWDDAKEAMDHWAEQLSERLVEWGAGRG